jgi:hypothetical protein
MEARVGLRTNEMVVGRSRYILQGGEVRPGEEECRQFFEMKTLLKLKADKIQVKVDALLTEKQGVEEEIKLHEFLRFRSTFTSG